MSIEGQLSIRLQVSDQGIQCDLSSSRPRSVNRLLIGKSLDEVLHIVPMLFNICGKAQTIATLRAAESYLSTAIDPRIEQQREALIWLESLREQLMRVFSNGSKIIKEQATATTLAPMHQTINTLFQEINANQSLLSTQPVLNSLDLQCLWPPLKTSLEKEVLGNPHQHWLTQTDDLNISTWASQQHTLAARFVFYLQQQTWQHAGSSEIASLNHWDHHILQQQLAENKNNFTQRPHWQGKAHEVSWFSAQKHHPLIAKMIQQQGNGIYTRTIARLVGIADLIHKLDHFFAGKTQPLPYHASNGLAHINTARGRLSHFIQLDNNTVKQLNILAPTEWNFHPQGVAVKSLENLQGNDITSLEQQAHCLIHAIDPCVGYTLTIDFI